MTPLLGRSAEVGVLRDLVTAVVDGRPGVVTLRGEPGSGRSALLAEAHRLAAAAECTTLHARGAGGVDDPAYVALAGLVRPLGPPVTEAVDRAIALGAEVDPMSVRMDVLRALTSAAEIRPVLLLLDDVDRLDPATAACLVFGLQRLGGDRVGAVVACGSERTAFAEVSSEVVPLAPLRASVLVQIVHAVADCHPTVAETIARWAHGSPQAAVELVRSLREDERRGDTPLPDLPRPTVVIVERLQAALDALPESARRALVVVAADRTGSLPAISAALATLGESPAALDAAEAAGVVTIGDGRCELTHPLLRPLAYRLVAAASRRSAHRALAAAMTQPGEAAERVWHLVAQSVGPDTDVAALVALVAEAEARRGAAGAAAAAYETAARLSPDAAEAAGRRLAAALAHLDALDADAAVRLARDGLAAGHPAGEATLATAVEWRDGPEVALGLDPHDGALVADLWLMAGDQRAARRAVARDGDEPLAGAVRAALDPARGLPPVPDDDGALGRRARRRWLATTAARGEPASPVRPDELLVCAAGSPTPGTAGAWLERAAALVGESPGWVPDQIRARRAAPAAPPAAGPLDQLTAAELRVARAVAAGRTNRQAADELFLSIKTVDFHLQTIYRKLEIRSRAQLATAVARMEA